MKIIISANEAWNIYNYRLYLIEKLLQNGHDVIIVAKKDNYSNILKQLGCKIHDVDFANSKFNFFINFILLIKFILIFYSYKPDYYFSFTIKPNIFGSFIANIFRIKSISTITGLGTFIFSGYIKKNIIKFLYRLSLKKCKKIIFQNKNDQEYFVNKKICRKENTKVIPTIGLDLGYFSGIKNISNSNTINLLYVGRLLYDKGLEELVNAITILKNENYKLNMHFVGPKISDNISQIPEKKINQWIDEKKIIFHNFTDNLRNLFEISHGVILPSYREGFPRSLMESCAYGRPIFASNVPGCSDVLTNNYNGFNFKKKNTNSIVNVIKKFIDLPYEKKLLLSINARKHAENKFDQSKEVNKYLNLIV